MAIVDISVEQSGLTSLDYVNTVLFNFPGKAVTAVRRAAKRAGSAGKTEAKKYASQIFNITPAKFTKNTATTVRVRGGGGGATKVTIRYAGGALDLLEFEPKITRTDGVRFETKRGKEIHLRHAFDIPAYGGHVYERVGKPRFPVRQNFGPSTPYMLRDSSVKIPLGERIMEVFNQRLSYEIGKILGK